MVAGEAEGSPGSMLSMVEGYLPYGCMASVSNPCPSHGQETHLLTLEHGAGQRTAICRARVQPDPVRPDLRGVGRRVPMDHDRPRRLGQHLPVPVEERVPDPDQVVRALVRER